MIKLLSNIFDELMNEVKHQIFEVIQQLHSLQLNDLSLIEHQPVPPNPISI